MSPDAIFLEPGTNVHVKLVCSVRLEQKSVRLKLSRGYGSVSGVYVSFSQGVPPISSL